MGAKVDLFMGSVCLFSRTHIFEFSSCILLLGGTGRDAQNERDRMEYQGNREEVTLGRVEYLGGSCVYTVSICLVNHEYPIEILIE